MAELLRNLQDLGGMCGLLGTTVGSSRRAHYSSVTTARWQDLPSFLLGLPTVWVTRCSLVIWWERGSGSGECPLTEVPHLPLAMHVPHGISSLGCGKSSPGWRNIWGCCPFTNSAHPLLSPQRHLAPLVTELPEALWH